MKVDSITLMTGIIFCLRIIIRVFNSFVYVVYRINTWVHGPTKTLKGFMNLWGNNSITHKPIRIFESKQEAVSMIFSPLARWIYVNLWSHDSCRNPAPSHEHWIECRYHTIYIFTPLCLFLTTQYTSVLFLLLLQLNYVRATTFKDSPRGYKVTIALRCLNYIVGD